MEIIYREEETNSPPESGGQRDREVDPARGGSKTASLQDCGFGTTPALRATPPDSGGESYDSQIYYQC
jgi:hypothetical protein